MTTMSETNVTIYEDNFVYFFPQWVYILFIAIVDIFTLLLGLFSAIAVFLNLFVLVNSLKRSKVPDNYRYLLIPNSINNILFCIQHYYIFYTIHEILNLFITNFEVNVPLFICHVGFIFYKLPLALNRVFALYRPLEYDYTFAEHRIVKLSISSFFAPYFLASLLILCGLSAVFIEYFFMSISLIFELICQVMHAMIYWRIRKQITSDLYNNLSEDNIRKLEMRQIIKANFLQSLIPLFLQFPFLLNSFKFPFMHELMILYLGKIFFAVSNLTVYVDPLCVLMIIKRYKQIWVDFLPKSKPIRYVSFILFPFLCIVLRVLVLILLAILINMIST